MHWEIIITGLDWNRLELLWTLRAIGGIVIYRNQLSTNNLQISKAYGLMC